MASSSASGERPNLTLVAAIQEGPEGLGSSEQDQNNGELILEVGEYSQPLEKSRKFGRGDQDRGIYNYETGQVLLADGMGSRTGGEAADIVIGSVAQQTHPRSLNGKPDSQVIDHIEDSLKRTNGELAAAIDSGSLEAGSGSTFAGFIPYIDDKGNNRVAIVPVGDSPIFRVRGGVLEKLSRDETVAGELHSTGQPIPKTVPNSGGHYDPHGIITNYFTGEPGYPKVTSKNVQLHDLKDGDRFIITSDGIEDVYTSKLEYPTTREWFERTVSDTSLTPQRVAEVVGSKDTDKVDDKLIYVVDVKLDSQELSTPEPADSDPSDSSTQPDPQEEGEESTGGKRRRSRSGGRRRREEAERKRLRDERRGAAGEHAAGDDDDHIDPDNPFAHLPPPPDFSSPTPHTPASPEGDDATPYPDHIRAEMEFDSLIQDVTKLREKLADLHNKKLWGVAGITRRREMKRVHREYDAKSRELTNVLLMGEFDYSEERDSETLAAQVTQRKIELLSNESREYARARNRADLNLYGRLVRKAGDLAYGPERKLSRRIGVGAVLAGGAVAVGAFAGPAALIALPVIRITKAATSGTAGHDSKQSSLRTHDRVITKKVKKLQNGENTGYATQDEFGDIIGSVRKSDSRRRAVSLAGQLAAVGGVLHMAPAVRDMVGHVKAPHNPFSHGGGSTHEVASHVGGGKFTNLKPEDVQAFKAANPGISSETLHAIDKDPKAFNQFIHSVQHIHERTGLEGQALNDRVTKTLALAHDKDAYMKAASARGIGAREASQAFDERFSRMVFIDSVNHIKETTGLTGPALLKRVNDTAALSQASDKFIAMGATPTEQYHRAQLLEQLHRNYFEHMIREEAAEKIAA